MSKNVGKYRKKGRTFCAQKMTKSAVKKQKKFKKKEPPLFLEDFTLFFPKFCFFVSKSPLFSPTFFDIWQEIKKSFLVFTKKWDI
jgi:hypothetical protein